MVDNRAVALPFTFTVDDDADNKEEANEELLEIRGLIVFARSTVDGEAVIAVSVAVAASFAPVGRKGLAAVDIVAGPDVNGRGLRSDDEEEEEEEEKEEVVFA